MVCRPFAGLWIGCVNEFFDLFPYLQVFSGGFGDLSRVIFARVDLVSLRCCWFVLLVRQVLEYWWAFMCGELSGFL